MDFKTLMQLTYQNQQEWRHSSPPVIPTHSHSNSHHKAKGGIGGDDSRNTSHNKLYAHATDEPNFRKMLDEVSRNFGFQEKFTQNYLKKHHNSASQVAKGIVPAAVKPPRKSMMVTEQDVDDVAEETKQVHSKDLSATEVMKDTHLVERYSKYLNKCLFITNDPFLRKKH